MIAKIAYVVLAAGSARRMGFAKVTTPLAGVSPIERLAATLRSLGEPRRITLVTSADQEVACARAFPGSDVLVNRAPERGMTSSLALADAALDRTLTIGVLLADKPFVTAATLLRCESALADGAFDVVYAAVDGEPGHPVYFAPSARAYIRTLPDGDTLRAVRDEATLSRTAVAGDDRGVVIDLDTPAAWHAAELRLLATSDAGAGAPSRARLT